MLPPPKVGLTFKLYTFTGNGPSTAPTLGNADTTAFQYQLQPGSGSSSSGTWVTALGSSTFTVTAPADGLYTMTARTAAVGALSPADAVATAQVRPL